jgi:hypothetical protein
LFAGYPITPASALLHHLARLRDYGVTTFQAEDEIAAICAAIGASYAGALGVTSSSGPGIALKGEALGLAIATELPLIVVNSQRGGPSTGLPTKTEQSDLFQAVWGRNGDAPMAVVATRSPSDCFEVAILATKLAVKYMTPIMVLTDGYLANASEPWLIPSMDRYEPAPVKFRTEPDGFHPFLRDPETLARAWAVPGTPGLEHRIGGIERASSLHIHDHTDPRRPVLVADLPIGDQGITMNLVGQRLYHQGMRQLTVIDVADKAHPRIIAQIPTVDTVWKLAIGQPWAWMASGSYGFQVADLVRGRVRTTLPTIANARRVVAEAEIAVVEEGTPLGGPSGHIEILDVSAPAWPRYLARIDQTVDKNGILLRGGRLYLGALDQTLKVYDLRDRRRPVELASLRMPNDPVGGRKAPIWRLAAEGDLLYMANDEWVRVFDISDPAKPTEVSSKRSNGGATDIAVGDKRAYVLGPATGVFTGRPSLQIFDFLKLDEPLAFGQVGALGFREGIQLRGTRVYVAGTDNREAPGGFQLFEVTNPDKPVEVSRLGLPGRTGDIELAAGAERVLLARSDNADGGELVDLDLSNPQAPRVAARQTLTDEGRDVALNGGLAIVAAGSSGIVMFQIDPQLPRPPTATPPPTPHAPLPFAAYLPVLGRGGLSKCP